MLTTSAKITDCQLEPDDKTKFVVTVTNSSPNLTANGVVAIPTLNSGNAKCIALTPRQVDFGSIGPKKAATRELEISTSNAQPNKYRVLFALKYSCEIPKQQCTQESFEVVKD